MAAKTKAKLARLGVNETQHRIEKTTNSPTIR